MGFAFLRFLVVLAVFLPALARAADMTPPSDPRFSDLSVAGSGRVDQVIDPVTLRLTDGTVVRLMGIDVPGARRVPVDEIAMAARAALAKLAEGKAVTLYQSRKAPVTTDRYGHLLAFAVLSEGAVWLQESLLSHGFARVWDGEGVGDNLSPLLAAEEQARNSSLGIWAPGSPDALFSPEDLPVTALGNPAVVAGKVIRIDTFNNDLTLRLGTNPEGRPDDLRIVIPAAARPDLSRAGIHPLDWKDQLVQVRGIIQADKAGPFVAISVPWQLQPIKTNLFSTP